MFRVRTLASRTASVAAARVGVWRAPSSRMALKRPLTPARYYAVGSTHPWEDFLSGTGSNYLDEMHRQWKEDPTSVHASWNTYFRNVEAGMAPGQAFMPPPGSTSLGSGMPAAAAAGDGDSEAIIADHLKVHSLIRGYQVRGHNIANLDPLMINDADLDSSVPPELDYKTYGFTEADLGRKFFLGRSEKGFLGTGETWTLREIIDSLERTYCSSIGFEYMHINSREKCDWIRERIEKPNAFALDEESKRTVMARIVRSHGFEEFLKTKWRSEKRFGLEGCEVLIPALKEIIDHSAEHGVEHVVMGMPHRGRLNVLANVIRKPLRSMFADFTGMVEPGAEGTGDVKYHLGLSHDRMTRFGRQVHLSLVANPSHLEAVNPVVEGKTRAEQTYRNDDKREQVMSVLMHGDAAFAGQGVVFETLGLSELPNYTTGGTIHVVVNNQVGFTTDPRFSRSTPYCTDVAKAVGAPVFHVNGDDPEAVIFACKLAVEWRQTFHNDVVLDIVCYRKHGHNEIDNPMFTQPLMYQTISKHKPLIDLFSKKLIDEGTVTKESVDFEIKKFRGICESEFDAAKEYKQHPEDWLESRWQGFKNRRTHAEVYNTGVDLDMLRSIGNVFSSYPEGFKVHSGLRRVLEARAESIKTGENIDWAMAEAFAFGSLLREGTHVRLSGQDVERGTFSHRHHVLHDQETEAQYVPLRHLAEDQASYMVCNSSLSEFGVLGFELGYSMTNPMSLILWEAQFGDFCNTAQTIIDQFIASGESKWLRQSGLTLLLPHGYEGQGPEHSSGRMERFLQMSDDDQDVFPDMDRESRFQIQHSNWQVVNCTTPANYFHVLRRQVHRDFRKPLIVFSPKSLLRHHLVKSKLSDFEPSMRFRRVIQEEEDYCDPAEAKRVILCTGKVYYDLLNRREEAGIKNVPIARVEQISPFPFDKVREQLDFYPNATEVVWAQEEPKNQGAFTYAAPRIETALRHSKHHQNLRPMYAGRPACASTATGSKKLHKEEEANLLDAAFGVEA